MNLSLAGRIGFVLVLALMCELTHAGLARERGPRVELVCPWQPIPFPIDQRTVLAYELHVTNFDSMPLTLKRVEISADTENGGPIHVLTGDSLTMAMHRAGAMSSQGTGTIESGAQVIIFLWIELQPNHTVPAVLHHRMIFSSAASPNDRGSSADAVLEDFPVQVSRHSAPTLSPPFNGGVWLAGIGPANNSDHRRAITAIDGNVHLAQRFAIDWIKVGPNGDSTHDGTARNDNWWGYGEPLLAVADGEITAVVDGIPENTPRVLSSSFTLDNLAGNYIILRIGPQLYATYAHLQPGSIQVRLHDRVRRGTILARLGNSGQATAPHLHFQVTDENSVFQSEGVPFVLEQFTYFGPGSSYELDKHPSVPWVRSIPPGDAVLEFKPNSNTQ